MKTTRTYGWTRTVLQLSKEAQAIYNETDPLQILEIEDEDGAISYDMNGCIEATGISADEVEAILISFGEDDEEVDADSLIGKVYDDPEGRWRITGISGDSVEIECIDSKVESNIGFESVVSLEEAIHYLTHDPSEW